MAGEQDIAIAIENALARSFLQDDTEDGIWQSPTTRAIRDSLLPYPHPQDPITEAVMREALRPLSIALLDDPEITAAIEHGKNPSKPLCMDDRIRRSFYAVQNSNLQKGDYGQSIPEEVQIPPFRALTHLLDGPSKDPFFAPAFAKHFFLFILSLIRYADDVDFAQHEPGEDHTGMMPLPKFYMLDGTEEAIQKPYKRFLEFAHDYYQDLYFRLELEKQDEPKTQAKSDKFRLLPFEELLSKLAPRERLLVITPPAKTIFALMIVTADVIRSGDMRKKEQLLACFA